MTIEPRHFNMGWNSLTALLAALAVVGLNAMFNHGLIPSMEPRFAEAVREMIHAGRYLIPIKNGVPYLEYPPLLYWLSIIPAKMGLPLEAAIRLPCYAAFLTWVWFMDRLQHLLWRHWPNHILALVGAACPGVLWQFFIAQPDALLICGVLIAFVGFAELRLGRDAGKFPWKLWLGVSIATAAKGPVGIAVILPAMVLEPALAVLLKRRPGTGFGRSLAELVSQLKSMAWLRGFALLAVFVAPGYLVLVNDRGWDFTWAVVQRQTIYRFSTGSEHVRPWWYYVQAAAVDFFPVSVFVPAGIWAAFRRLSGFSWRMPLVWALYTFGFFTLAVSKQSKYLLPSAPALVVLGILGVEALFGGARVRAVTALRWWARGLIIMWAVLVVAVLPFFSPHIADEVDYAMINRALSDRPGKLVYYHWPRSIVLYELGAPMAYVRSSRELYQAIRNGRIKAGDYLLVSSVYLPKPGQTAFTEELVPPPEPPWFEHVLTIPAEKHLSLYRVLPEAADQPLPETPEPPALGWLEARIDTD